MFKVPSVIFVTAMVDCKARQREEERRQRKKSDSFAEVLQETRKELQMKDGITYQAAGLYEGCDCLQLYREEKGICIEKCHD